MHNKVLIDPLGALVIIKKKQIPFMYNALHLLELVFFSKFKLVFEEIDLRFSYSNLIFQKTSNFPKLAEMHILNEKVFVIE